MKPYGSSCYHYPRWPLFRQTTRCVLWLIPGLIFLLLPLGWSRLIGLFPIAVSILQWQLQLRPKWEYIIKTNTNGLKVGSRTYPWRELVQLRIKRDGKTRFLCLSRYNSIREIIIKDELPHFDKLAQECFFYMNRKVESQKQTDT